MEISLKEATMFGSTLHEDAYGEIQLKRNFDS